MLLFDGSKQERKELSRDIAALSFSLCSQERRITTVESCTGGLIAALFTDFAGSSAWFDRGFVTYSNASKVELVGVKSATLARYGAVSEQVAAQMAEGGIVHSHAQCALSVTGVAGPAGGSASKPVGMVCFAWAGFAGGTSVKTEYFQGDRRMVRAQSVMFAVKMARQLQWNSPSDKTI
jgi:nicotinamide-nucleotide amidase